VLYIIPVDKISTVNNGIINQHITEKVRVLKPGVGKSSGILMQETLFPLSIKASEQKDT
jgi:hypothetical protein